VLGRTLLQRLPSLLLEPRDDTAIALYASAGPGGPTFDDLIIDLVFEPG